MSRILVVATSSKTRGGISAVLNLVAKEEVWKKYNCKWIATHRDGPNWRKVYILIANLFRYVFLLPFADIVYIHFSTTVSARRKYLFFRLAELFHKKIVIHLHCGNQLGDIWSPTYEYMFMHADHAFVLSEGIKADVERFLQGRKQVDVLYNPCPNVENDYTLRKKNVLFAGTVIKGKGIFDLVRAFKSVAEKHPDWKLVIAGNGETDKCKAIAHELHIENNVECIGWIVGDLKDRAFREASIFCLPSYAEGFPMAILDAWAYGLPVVTTPVGGIPNLAKDGDNALFVTPADERAIADRICRLIEDRDCWALLAGNAYSLSHGALSISNMTRELDVVFNKLSASSK